MNIDQIRARLAHAKEHVKADPWYVSTNVYIADVGELLAEVDRQQKLYESMERTWQKAETELAATQKQLEAAVEDMKNIVDAVRQKHCDDTCCFACKYDADFSIMPSGDYANECPGFDRDDCFEWRGAKEQTNGTP